MTHTNLRAEPVAVQVGPTNPEGQLATSTSTSTIILQGRSGAKYEFTLYPWGTDFKAIGGVYVVLQSRTDGVIYIGQTGDLSERFDNHHKASCFSRQGKTHIGVRVESSERNRLAIEQDLIANYHPPCND